jgi:hypothetical protein
LSNPNEHKKSHWPPVIAIPGVKVEGRAQRVITAIGKPLGLFYFPTGHVAPLMVI